MSMALPNLDGRLELKGLLGEGGMGQVHRAWDRTLERAVAVKFVRSDDPREAEKLLLEARLQARVEHPNVVRVHEVGTLDGRPCIVMQLVEGTSLADFGEEVPLQLRIELLQQAAHGLHAAHLQGLIHRDVKPGNVLVEMNEHGHYHALVSDFGLARDEEGGLLRSGPVRNLPPDSGTNRIEESGLTRTLLQAGTLDFMAPEVLLGAGPVDFRVDVYGLGATGYLLLSGNLPFRTITANEQRGATSRLWTGNAGDRTEMLRRILQEQPAPMVGIPADLRTIVFKALEKTPADRYNSAEAFADDLGRYLHGEPILARSASRADRLLKWSRRNPIALRATLLALLTAVLGLGHGLWTIRRAATQSLEAALLGAEAASMEELMRSENLLPLHDLRPAHNRIRAILADLPRHARIAPGPAAFVLGRGLQLLGQTEPAREALSRAWEQGFRLSSVAQALGLAEGQRYAEELALLPRFEDSKQKEARVREIQKRLREPALARLGLASRIDAQSRPLLEARMAFFEERYEAAVELAVKAAQEPTATAEAFELQGQALLEAGLAHYYTGHLPEALVRLRNASASLRTAGIIARSAQAPRLALARAELWAVKIRDLQGTKDPEAMTPVDEALREAARIDPESGAYLTICTEVESERGRLLTRFGKPSWQAYETAIGFGRRAVVASSDPRRALERLAWACLNMGRELLNSADRDPQTYWREGLDAATRAQALSPDSSTPITLEIQMLSDRSDWDNSHSADGSADASRAVSGARRLILLDQQPIVARKLAAQALRSLGICKVRAGSDPAQVFDEALTLAEDAVKRSNQDASTLAYGLYIASTSMEVGLLEGRVAVRALTLGNAWADRLLMVQKGDFQVAGQVGEWTLFRARAEALSKRDPGVLLNLSETLLRPASSAGAAAIFWQRLAEVALERALWLKGQGRATATALTQASRLAGRFRAADPTSPEVSMLEARIYLEQTPAQPGKARSLAEAVTKTSPREAPAWFLLARAELALGHARAAKEALGRAQTLQPRLAGCAELAKQIQL
jgi:serine/threonine-protein kinase